MDWENERNADPLLQENWNIVKNWSEESRYQANRTEKEAQDYYSAVADVDHGVLRCIRNFW